MTKIFGKKWNLTLASMVLGIILGITTLLAFKPSSAPPESASKIFKIGATTEIWRVQDYGTIFYVVINTTNGNTSVIPSK
jgi:hypothetical protein